MKALVDTGAEVSVIRKDLVEQKHLRPSAHPVRLDAANSTQLCGGFHDVEVILGFQATEMEQSRPTNLRIPLIAYEASIKHDIILSYGWLAKWDGLVNPKRHGILFKNEKYMDMFWVPGIPSRKVSDIVSVSPFIDEDNEIPIPYTNLHQPKKKGKRKVSFDLDEIPPPPPIPPVEIMDIEVLVDRLHFWGLHTLQKMMTPSTSKLT